MATPVSYDEIKPGAVFEPSDFANPYYLPGGKYRSLEVLEEGDDDFRVLYHGRDEYDDRIQVIEREQMYQMLGLEGVGDNPSGRPMSRGRCPRRWTLSTTRRAILASTLARAYTPEPP